jgi:exonuclease VII large subunit
MRGEIVMKKLIIILLLVLGIHVTISSRAQTPTMAAIHKGMDLTDKQKAQLLHLNNRYDFQVRQLCDHYKQGTNLRFIKRTQEEFEYIKQKLQKKLRATIDEISSFCARLGVPQQEVQTERTEMLKSLTCWASI